ncbi:ABC transporter substrate-binding protein [Deinococcus roseus]|uniref:ABC transporter substrate-binding protein n=1 Tax=Deinococcus roseus TaxID=392414 RepID=A0ABQ2D2V5_9DEIO|nr:sugar ABC transporter substrate-binding protein [Deinococcus roseus]GGJ43566.1 ABC transporter substrate-binding protein [Deinococcus roseus]
MKRTRPLLSLLSLALLAQAAQAETLTVLVEGGGFQLQEAIAKKWEKTTGNKVTFVNVPYAGVLEKLSAEMASGSASFDVATVDVAWLPMLQGFAEPLDSLFTAAVRKDIFPALLADAQYGGHYIGMPTWTNAEILLYRKDLFADPRNKADFKKQFGYDLKVPTTWKTFQDAAKFFTRDTNKDGIIDLYGTDVKGKVETEFLAYALQAGAKGLFVDDKGNALKQYRNEYVSALKYLTDLYRTQKVSPQPLDVDWNAAQQLFYQGKSAMTIFWAHAYKLTPEDSKVEGKVGAAPIIGGKSGAAAIAGSWYNIVPKTSKKKALAEEFVKFAYQNNVLGLDAPLGLAARKSAFASYQKKPGYEHLSALIKTLNFKNTAGRPRVESWQQITDEVLVPMIQDAFSGKKTPEQAVDWALSEVENYR